jgi:hypothetical protein
VLTVVVLADGVDVLFVDDEDEFETLIIDVLVGDPVDPIITLSITWPYSHITETI